MKINQNQTVQLEPGYFGKEVESKYGREAQHWPVVYLHAAYDCEVKTLEKARAREQETA